MTSGAVTPSSVLVAGEALVDLTPTDVGGALAYLPCPGGGPFNTAVGLGRLGVPVAFFGRLSHDGFGRLLASRLAEAGVQLAFTLHGDEPTPLAVVTPGAPGQENEFQFYVERTADRLVTAADLPTDLSGVAALHVGTLGLHLEPVATSLELLVTREAGHRLVGYDPNVRPALVGDRAAFTARVGRIATLADVVKVSDADAAWLAPGTAPEQLAARWVEAGAGLVVITRGAAGAVAMASAAGRVEAEAVPADVVDTVGAGDAFNAGLLTWLHDHGRLSSNAVRALGAEEVAAALQFAATVAAATCGRAGADPPWRHELG